MNCESTPFCCALAEADGLNDPGGWNNERLVCDQVAELLIRGRFCCEESPRFAHAILTQALTGPAYRGNNSPLHKIKRFIEKNRLGVVTLAPSRRNPNSGNMVRPAIFSINPVKSKRFIARYRKENPLKYKRLEQHHQYAGDFF